MKRIQNTKKKNNLGEGKALQGEEAVPLPSGAVRFHVLNAHWGAPNFFFFRLLLF